MLNIAFAFEDAIEAVSQYGEHLDITSLVPAVFMMQRDVLNHYRYGMEHYFTISLDEPYLQNSSLGSPYQKWAFFVNENHSLLSLMIRQLLRYTSRLVHETECKRKHDLHEHSEAKQMSNSYTSPICEIRYADKQIGIRVHEDQRLTVTWVRKEPRPERVMTSGRVGEEPKYFLIETGHDGDRTETPITKEAYSHFSESVSQTDYSISDRSALNQIKSRGAEEIDHLQKLCSQFGDLAERFLSDRQICTPYTNLNESFWT